jgi:hypothetical protein
MEESNSNHLEEIELDSMMTMEGGNQEIRVAMIDQKKQWSDEVTVTIKSDSLGVEGTVMLIDQGCRDLTAVGSWLAPFEPQLLP